MLLLVLDHGHLRAMQSRALLVWLEPANSARGVGIVTVRQLKAGLNQPCRAMLEVIHRGLEAAGVEFIDENGGGPGVRLRKQQKK